MDKKSALRDAVCQILRDISNPARSDGL